MRTTALLACTLALASACAVTPAPTATVPPLRVATYNVSLNHDQPGGLIAQLEADHLPARRVAAVIQRVRPDLLLLNEFDFDRERRAEALFVERYLGVGQFGEAPIAYPFRYSAEVNTGVPSGLDLDGDGRNDGPGDAWGFGRHPGQFGMLVLSRHRLDVAAARSFRLLRWAALPDALAPVDPASGAPWYPPAIWPQLRLSSKAHWDLPVDTPQGRLHFLVAHPTPPVFDGPEDRNGRRNHDEIRLWADYLSDPHASWLCDDAGRCGGLATDARFVIAGDYNADPHDGESHASAIQQLLAHPRVLRYPAPRSLGGAAGAARAGAANLAQRGDPAEDTAMFGPRIGNMRVDYVLPSIGWRVLASGVFWPPPGAPEASWVEASDHRLVWVDLLPADPP